MLGDKYPIDFFPEPGQTIQVQAPKFNRVLEGLTVPESIKPTEPVAAIIFECSNILNKKRADYSPGEDRFSNFKFTAHLLEHFTRDEDLPYVALIGTKLSRLSELLRPGRHPFNEPVKDSFIDLINYCILWAA